MSDQDDLMTVRDVARVCNRSEETVRRWIWSRKLRALKLGNQMFVERRDLESMQAPRAGEAKTAYSARSRKRVRKPPMSEFQTEVLDRLTKKRDELVARYGAADVDELLRQVRDGEAFYTVGPQTKEGKLAHLERAVALGKEISAKYGPVNVSDLIHEIREEEEESDAKPRTKEEILDFLEKANELGKRIGKKHGSFDVGEMAHESHRDH